MLHLICRRKRLPNSSRHFSSLQRKAREPHQNPAECRMPLLYTGQRQAVAIGKEGFADT